MAHTISLRGLLLVALVAANLSNLRVSGQLPDDIQRELNQNLAEQARIQAMRQRHQQQIQARTGAGASAGSGQQQQQPHDPNNYSYQQVSPPVQYSYYQPFGDAAANSNSNSQPSQPQQAPAAQKIPADAFDLNNLNFELPKPQAQVAAQAPPAPLPGPHLTPSFTGPGGLPVLQPMAAAQVSGPQSGPQQAQQGPPLTEADFKDITGGENYGAPAGAQPGADFGLGDGSASPSSSQRRQDTDTDAQLREFGFPGSSPRQQQAQLQPPQLSNQMGPVNMADFGLDEPTRPQQQQQQQPRRQDPADEFGFGAGGSGAGLGEAPAGSQRPPSDFDFAIQPSASQQGAASGGGGAPGSLQSLLGSGFPGLGGGSGGAGGSGGLDSFASGANDPQRPQTQRAADDGSLEVADLGDRADGFSGADLGQFEQPTPRNDDDFNYAAANNQQPMAVPYPDGAPQPVGTLLALTQPQSMTQTRYSPLPDKGTFQDYPAYQTMGASGPQMSWQVRSVVARTPRARRPGPGRYGQPAPSALAPEFRTSGGHFNYARGPLGASGYE